MSYQVAKLAARVKAVNKAHDYANKLYPTLRAIFEPLVGQSILKVNGDLLQKVEKLLPTSLPKGMFGLRVYRHRSDYSLAWTVSANENIVGQGSCLYHEVTVYIGDLSGTVLKGLSEPQERKTDYQPEEVQRLRAVYEAKKKEADDARSDLHPFGEYDN